MTSFTPTTPTTATSPTNAMAASDSTSFLQKHDPPQVSLTDLLWDASSQPTTRFMVTAPARFMVTADQSRQDLWSLMDECMNMDMDVDEETEANLFESSSVTTHLQQ
jgi:hypothetical protein